MSRCGAISSQIVNSTGRRVNTTDGSGSCAGSPYDMAISGDQLYNVTMKQIAAARFKERCLALIDEVDADGIVITKRGRPVAKLIPFGADSAGLIGALKGRLVIKGDILNSGAGWDAEP